MDISKLIAVTNDIRVAWYPDAAVVFLAGSLVRGEGTAYSDLDLVVVYEELPNAYRESFVTRGLPVEAFVHDPETLNHFLTRSDRPAGMASLAQMILEGVEVPSK